MCAVASEAEATDVLGCSDPEDRPLPARSAGVRVQAVADACSGLRSVACLGEFAVVGSVAGVDQVIRQVQAVVG
jgi:hypothetical protein